MLYDSSVPTVAPTLLVGVAVRALEALDADAVEAIGMGGVGCAVSVLDALLTLADRRAELAQRGAVHCEKRVEDTRYENNKSR